MAYWVAEQGGVAVGFKKQGRRNGIVAMSRGAGSSQLFASQPSSKQQVATQ